jgi:HD superfamily phosphohydrolase
MPSRKVKLQTTGAVFCREIRDPINDYIFITDFEDPVLDSSIFQRLDRVFQMPTAHLVYPSAKHTRKTHSLGVMQLAHEAIIHILYSQYERISSEISPLFWHGNVVTKDPRGKNLDRLRNLRENWWNDQELDYITQGIRLAGMLHDVGHPPFSHLFEDICRSLKINMEYEGSKKLFDHEIMSRKIIEEREDEIGIKSPFTADYINDILDKESGKAPLFVKEIINSGYDCDKMDYLLRDAYAAGAVEFGRIDCNRIISGFKVVDEQLCVSTSAIDALMNSFDALQYMYSSVYYHRTARIFDHMIQDALSKIPEFLQGVVADIDTFLNLDDYNFIDKTIEYVKDNRNGENKDVIDVLRDYKNRKKKYMEIFLHRLTSGYLLVEDTNKALEELEKELGEMAKNLEIRIDFRPRVRPVGIALESLRNWLMEERIYNPEDGKVESLHDVSRAFHDKLKHYTILFRVFANRSQLDPSFDIRNKYRTERDKIRQTAEEKLRAIEEQYEKLR